MATGARNDKFSLRLHPSGQWAKKHKGQFNYFGTDKDAALKRFVAEWDDIKAGRKHRPETEDSVVTMSDAVHAFLSAKRRRVGVGEWSEALRGQYYSTCDKVIAHLGRGRTVSEIRPEEFGELRAKKAANVGPVTLLGFLHGSQSEIQEGATSNRGSRAKL